MCSYLHDLPEYGSLCHEDFNAPEISEYEIDDYEEKGTNPVREFLAKESDWCWGFLLPVLNSLFVQFKLQENEPDNDAKNQHRCNLKHVIIIRKKSQYVTCIIDSMGFRMVLIRALLLKMKN